MLKNKVLLNDLTFYLKTLDKAEKMEPKTSIRKQQRFEQK